MIGHIQSRKANAVVDKFDYIHSVDREKVANKISRSISNPDFPLGVLLECNVSGEAAKGGWKLDIEEQWPEHVKLLSPLFSLQGVRIDGLMTMAPYNASDDQLHTVFGRLQQLRNHMQDALGVELSELSMGMTDDFEIAIQEGATLIRVGRAIFGER